MVQILQVVAIVVGSCLLGSEFGWKIGLAIGLLGYGLMPYQAH